MNGKENALIIEYKDVDKSVETTLAINLRNAITRLKESGIELSRLVRIVFARDYDGAIKRLASNTGTESHITREEYAVGIAKTLLNRTESDFEFTIVLGGGIGDELLSGDEGRMINAFHYLHHELGHVDDINRKSQFLASLQPNIPLNGAKAYYWPLANTVWGEYYASRISSSSATQEILEHYFGSLFHTIPATPTRMEEVFAAYSVSKDIDQLRSRSIQHGGFLAISTAYVLGYLDGHGADLQHACPMLHDAIYGSYFKVHYERIRSSISRMHRRYKEWSSIDDFDGLIEAIEYLLENLGFAIRDLPGGQIYCGYLEERVGLKIQDTER